jgi:surfactin synthase thioesterase subunit
VSAPQTWLRRFHAGHPDAPVLICLPHAGGSATAYWALSQQLSPGVEVRAVQYPGRQDRHAEPAHVAMDDLVEALLHEVREVIGRPYALFGHSMGAVVAFELALRLGTEQASAPLRLFASGRRAPSCLRDENVHRRSDEGMLSHVAGLGGILPDMLAEPDVRAMVLPALRGDYTLIETYRTVPGRTLYCPVTVLTGDRDPLVSQEEARAWERHTTASFELKVFAGGHFFLNEDVPAVARTVADRLIPSRGAQHTS